MKKLMAMLVSLACASGAWAAKNQSDVYPSGVDFDSVEIEEGKTEADYTISGDAKWSGATGSEDVLKVMAWKDGDYSGTYPERLVTSFGSEKNYLSLETTFATPLYRAIKDDMVADDTYGEQVYLDSLVNLTAGEASSLDGANLLNDARIALWLQEGDADVENSTPVLCIKAATYDSDGRSYSAAVFTNTWTVTAGWHRLTVRCFKDVTRTGAGIPAYAVYVDGVAVTAKVKAFPDTTGFVPKCAALAKAGSLFGSLQGAKSGAAESNIKAVGFAGNGKVDDIIFTTTKPNLENIDDTNYFHLTWDEGVKSIAYVIGEGQSVTVDCTEGEAGATDIALTGEAMSIAVTVTYSEGCVKGVWTAENGAGIDDGATTFTIGKDAVTPGGAIVSASTKTVGSAVVTIGGTALETITATTLSGLIEAIGTAIADQTLADTDTIYIKLMDNVEFENSDGDGYISLGTTAGVWTLDLNGKTVTCNASSAEYQAIVNMGTLVVTDSSSGKLGKIEFASTENIGYAVYNYASGRNAVLTIEAGTFDGIVSGAVDEEASGDVTSTITITGGKFLASANQTPAETETGTETFSLAGCVDTEKYSITLADGYYVVATKGGDTPTPVDPTWETILGAVDSDGFYTIDDIVDLKAFQANAKTIDTEGVSFALTADIDLADYPWPSVGLYQGGSDYAYSFKGTFDGRGHEIKNVTFADLSENGTVADINNYRGFFGYVVGGTIKDLTIQGTGFGTVASEESGCALVVGCLDTKVESNVVVATGSIEGCTAKGSVSGTHNAAGICVSFKGGVIKNCTNEATVASSYKKAGGIVAMAYSERSTQMTIENCANKGAVTVDGSSKAGLDGVGGFVGSHVNGPLTVRDCVNSAQVSKGSSAASCDAVGQIIGGAYVQNLTMDGTNRVLPGIRTIGVTYQSENKSVYTGNVSGLNYAATTTDGDGLVTLAQDDALAYDGTTTYIVMAPNRTNTLATTTAAVTFNESLCDIEVVLDESLTNAYNLVTTVVGETTDKVTTYAVEAKPVPVAKINDTTYTSLQAALDAAVASATAENPVTITILADCSFDSTITLVGKGADTTKITIENDKVVSFPTGKGVYGIFLDGLSLTLKGTGTWQKTAESASMFLAGEKSAAANITVEGGNFYAKSASCIMNVQQGVITVNGGTFTTENAGGYCVRAEKSDVTKTTGGEVLVTAGTFNGPTTDGTTPLVGIKDAASVAAGAEAMILVSDNVKAVGSAKAADLMGEYLVTKTGTDEYTYTDDYKFKLTDVANTYAITAIEWAKLTVTWDAGVKSFTVTESASGDSTNVVISADLDSFVEQYDKDDGESVTITVTLNDGYTLNNEASTLTGIAMTVDQTIALATTKTAVEPTTYDPGEVEKTTYAAESDATAEAQKINDAIEAGTASINAPTGLSDDATKAYKALFAAKVVTVTDGGSTSYQVKIDFTDQATSDLQAQVDADVKIVELTKIAAAEDDASVETEVTTTPGLWYTVYAGNDLTAELTATSCKQATDAKTKLEFPKKGTRGFYKVGVSITSTLLQNQQ